MKIRELVRILQQHPHQDADIELSIRRKDYGGSDVLHPATSVEFVGRGMVTVWINSDKSEVKDE